MSDHSHTHAHDHAHGHHDHDHAADAYYLDQLCMVGLCGAFGVICLSLYFWQTGMLNLLLGPQFHPAVLLSGIALVIVSAVRAAALWHESGRTATAHAHDHHEHDHDHAHDHDHGHSHEGCCGHDHAHDHEHAHGHHHGHSHDHADHDHADHDHGWAPWRYVIMLLPIMLFLLGLPNKGPEAREPTHKVDTSQDAAGFAGLIAAAPDNAVQVSTWLAALYLGGGDPEPVNFKQLEAFAAAPATRAEWQGKTVTVRGQFMPMSNDRVFSLVRFRIQCCAADAIQLNVPIVSRESLFGLQDRVNRNDWVKVTGTVAFRENREKRGEYFTAVMVPSLRAIEQCPPDTNPWVRD
jgi:DUF1980 C-terminal domain